MPSAERSQDSELSPGCRPFHKAESGGFHEQRECTCVVPALLHRSAREDPCSRGGSSSWPVLPGSGSRLPGGEAGLEGEAVNSPWRFKLLTARAPAPRTASPFPRSNLPSSHGWARALFSLPGSPLPNTLPLPGTSPCNPKPRAKHSGKHKPALQLSSPLPQSSGTGLHVPRPQATAHNSTGPHASPPPGGGAGDALPGKRPYAPEHQPRFHPELGDFVIPPLRLRACGEATLSRDPARHPAIAVVPLSGRSDRRNLEVEGGS